MGGEEFYQLFLLYSERDYLCNLVSQLGSQMGDKIIYKIDPFHSKKGTTFRTWCSTWVAQIGDEAFHQLFLFIQIGNYLWNLVFHLGSPDGRQGILPIVPFNSDRELLVEPGVPPV